jgi:hypothetical protein
MGDERKEIVSLECRGPAGCYFSNPRFATVQLTGDPNRNKVTCSDTLLTSDKNPVVFCFFGSQLVGNLSEHARHIELDQKVTAKVLEGNQCVKCIRAYPR